MMVSSSGDGDRTKHGSSMTSGAVDTNAGSKKKKKKQNKRKPMPLVRPPSAANKPNKKRRSSSHEADSGKKEEDGKNNNNNNNNNKKKKKHFSSTAESLALIKAYHTLNKRLEQNARDEALAGNEVERERRAEAIRSEQLDLGGIDRYQQASMFGAKSSKFVCARWVEPLLRQHIAGGEAQDEDQGQDKGEDGSTSKPTDTAVNPQQRQRPRILDVGAIDNQYLQYKWMDAVPIDLNAQHKSVVEADFFDYATEHITSDSGAAFDAVVLSLVLNFQGDPRKRGDMLALAADARLLRLGGLVFIALPSASLDNSRYCDEEYLIDICRTLGLEVVERKRSAKLALLAFQQRSYGFRAYDVASKTFRYTKEVSRQPAKSGQDRNNFAVMLRNSTPR
mmetsp:Transcript_23531/g.50984  ORF Transcript_23531/g.50984 Transcript_23531/m.50984 type:complete len:393 (-) Transcript_23531:89-1267(-)|eukprot:CAMPEP_0172321088 /NCGR_PEP_ID=MMETSP1058-20130122/42280_1 /TAXON_ID=83371 /ORGANISM="Detonula confervacea, Strain CCMP 353" /LENGTH=392 /DNA_ID=CAMNT_0013036495 /DNA_START=11 /DNA_END=1189 /DNA_ORIENTATION=+